MIYLSANDLSVDGLTLDDLYVDNLSVDDLSVDYLLRGTILNRTYGTQTPTYFAIFTNNIWSYLILVRTDPRNICTSSICG